MWWYVCAYTDVQDLVPGTQLFLIKKKGSLTQYPPYHRSLSVQRNAKHWVECQQALQNDP
jgi:hypothetical protein